MKLVRRTANTLTMHYVPWGTWLLASYLIVKAVAIGFFTLNQPTLTCTRNLQQPTQGRCWTSGLTLPEGTKRYWELKQITGATLIASSDNLTSNGQNRELYDLVLVTNQEQVALPIFPSNQGDIQHRVEKIQDFLANPAQSRLTIYSYELWTMIVAAVLFIVICAGIVGFLQYLGSIRTLRLNKITGTVTFEKTFFRTRIVEYPLKDAMTVAVLRSRFSQVVIGFQGGRLLYLHPIFGGFPRTADACNRCAEQIRDFLDLPSKSK